MTRSQGKRPFRLKNTLPRDPAIHRIGDWLPANRGFYDSFRGWLKQSSYSEVSIHIYGVAARKALGLLMKPYWRIDPEADIARVEEHLRVAPIRASTRMEYLKGLAKLAQYLRLRSRRPAKEKEVRWDTYLGPLPAGLQTEAREFIRFCQLRWPLERRHERKLDVLSTMTRSLRWMAAHHPLEKIADLTPQAWFAYLDERLSGAIRPRTLNSELARLKHFVHFLLERNEEICERFLLVDYLEEGRLIPKDIPVAQLRLLLEAIQEKTRSGHAGLRRLGRMDLAWFLLMLHSGLRTGEIRSLKLADIEWEARRVRIEQSKGLKDRLVYLSGATITALRSYLEVRGPAEALPEYVFVFRHDKLTKSYCYERLRTYGERCGVHATPHQLRHSCGTLLLNAGAPVLVVQAILGHKYVDTTLGYARLYDGTIAADYYRAMTTVEQQMALPEDRLAQPPSPGEMLALVDALRGGTLNPAQVEIVRALRSGLVALAGQDEKIMEVKALAEIR